MGITAKARSATALTGTTALEPAEVLSLIKEVGGHVKGGGKSLVTTGIANIGAQVNVMRESPESLVLSLTSGKKLIELCTFSVSAVPDESGRTRVRVGGLETYKTSQSKFLYLIPVGPKMIYGMAPYKRFLDEVDGVLRRADPSASLSVSQPA